MTAIAPHQLDELELSNLASFWAGVRAGARMNAALDADDLATGSLNHLIGDNLAAEVARALTEILLRAEPKPKPRPPAEPRLPVRTPARPGGRPRR